MTDNGERDELASAGTPYAGPRCPECRMGLGSHDVQDPLCDFAQVASATLRQVDRTHWEYAGTVDDWTFTVGGADD